MTKTPALPAYIELSDEAAPMKLDGIVEDGAVPALVLMNVGAYVDVVPIAVVPTAVGPAVVLLCAP